jgi:glutamyl-tRNA reductase
MTYDDAIEAIVTKGEAIAEIKAHGLDPADFFEEIGKKKCFAVESTARQAAPLVASMHEAAERVRSGELDRFANRLNGLDESGRGAVEALTKAIIAKLLHEPSVRLKGQAGTPQGDRNAAAVRDLFDLS